MSTVQKKIQNKFTHQQMQQLNCTNLGFTLIELMIVVGIVGILLAIAVPSYSQHMSKSRRADAKAILLDLAGRQERFYSTNNTYTNNLANLGYTTGTPMPIPSNTQYNYAIRITAASNTAFTAQAAPNGSQAGDRCGTFTIDNLGRQGVAGGTLTANQCW